MKKRFLEITDMPQDRGQVLYKLMPLLVRAFNDCRDQKYKMALLKSTMKFIYNKCSEFEKHTTTQEDKVTPAVTVDKETK